MSQKRQDTLAKISVIPIKICSSSTGGYFSQLSCLYLKRMKNCLRVIFAAELLSLLYYVLYGFISPTLSVEVLT